MHSQYKILINSWVNIILTQREQIQCSSEYNSNIMMILPSLSPYFVP